jgi:hypothetical protein
VLRSSRHISPKHQSTTRMHALSNPLHLSKTVELTFGISRVVDAVALKGYEIQTLKLPTIPSPNTTLGVPTSMYDDAAYVAQVVEGLANQDKDVLLISHSYGGVPMTQSVKGLSKKDRKKQDKKGGIVRLAYLTSLVPDVGQSGGDVLAKAPPEDQLEFEIDVRLL